MSLIEALYTPYKHIFYASLSSISVTIVAETAPLGKL